MASYGQSSRGKPALYKPTDFGREQGRSQTNSMKEVKTDEKVVKKIQKRPPAQEEEKPVKVENNKTPSILKAPEQAKPSQKGSANEYPSSNSNGKSKGLNSNKQKDKAPSGVSQRDVDKIKQLQEFMAKQQLNGTSGSKANGKEDKDKADKKDNNRNNGSSNFKDDKNNKQPQKNRRRENSSRSSQRPSTKNEKYDDKERNQGKNNSNSNVKDKEQTRGKSDKKDSQTSSGGTRMKTNQGHQKSDQKNHGRGGFGGSFYSHSGFPPGGVGFPNEMALLQMQYAMAGGDKQSILGNPYNQTMDYNKPQKDKPKTQPKVQPAKPNPPPLNKSATSDKSERQKSLDFVKNFFDTDPEVQYNRKHNAEKQAAAAIPTTPVEKSPVVDQNTNQNTNRATNSKQPFTSNQPLRNTIPNQHPMKLQNTNTQTLMQNNTAQYDSGMSVPYSSAYHTSSYHHHMTDIPNSSNLQLGAHASMPTGRQPSYLQNQTALQQRISQASLHHTMAASGNALYAGVSQHQQSSLHHHQAQPQQQHAGTNYQDMFSQMSVSSALSPGSNPYGMLQQNTAVSNNPMGGFSMYSGYFPQGNHHSHVQHVEQQLDSNVMEKILEEQNIKTKKWQEATLSKCGPIDSKQARSLIEQLVAGTYECMVCCEAVKWNNAVWSCANCYHIFHLNCIRKWARSEAAAVKDESGWRCPGCQNVSTRPPNKYYCFCGKVRDPEWNPRDGLTPHSCGEICKKKRVTPPCEHTCNELCHPGPCPSCPVMVTKYCPCGKTSTKTRCGQLKLTVCGNACSKILNCRQHRCQKKCHEGKCEDCEVKHNEGCYCGKERRVTLCGTGEVLVDEQPKENVQYKKNYTCNQQCEKLLSCGKHSCKEICHKGDCNECPLLPKNLRYCPCGKHLIESLLGEGEGRKYCTDPIPTCESFCGKKLNCGPKGSSHLCMMKCHNGPCLPCAKATVVQCRCGATKKEIPCKELKPGEPVLCERKCNKKRKCGRHKCNQKCCLDREHNCNIICGKKLSCGAHKCEEVCHTGFCPQCWRAGFDELACRCGSTVLYPPIACGAKPPECDQPCNRVHPCGHQPLHTCHNEETCPPCTVLTTKQCMGSHEIWKNVPCHLTDVSCGRKCGKVLKCGLHSCAKICHKGACLEENDKCTQPCPVKRRDCAHPCGVPCHPGRECPVTACKAQVRIKCRCDRKSAYAVCLAGNPNSAYQSFNAEMLSSQLHNLQSGQSIDLSKLTNGDKRPKFLECDEECARLERNKRVAEALGIENPEEGHFQPVHFSPSLRQEAKSQFQLVKMVEDILENIITLAKKSTNGQAQHSFPPMNSTQRRLIHELAEVYNCKTYSLDQEPKRNTVVLATKDSIIPNSKLSVITEREIMKPLPPQPIMINQDNNPLLLGSPTAMKPILKHPNQTNGASSQKVNYFDDEFLE